jgi:ribonucleotide reductase alpha subunit
MNKRVYTYDEALKEAIAYFDGDEMAANVFLQKYAERNNDGELTEATPVAMHHRMAKEYARIEKQFGGDHQLSEETIFNLLDHFKYIITGGSVMSGLGKNTNRAESLSNCFVLGAPKDSYASIMRYRDFMVEVEKRRGGAGVDLSNLRPAGSIVHNAAVTSTGAVSFMNGFSELSKEVAQGGRRGALMISINGNHPDVEEFIVSKQDLSKITGANISVQFSDEFMNAVKNNERYMLRWPVTTKQQDVVAAYYAEPHDGEMNLEPGEKHWLQNGKLCYKIVDARKLWDVFVHCAWNTAEPGLLYSDKHRELSPDSQYEEFKGVTTNPCVTADTLVKTPHGEVYIDELIQKFNAGEKVTVFSFNTGTGVIEEKPITFGAKTRENAKIIRIETEHGNVIKLTPDHKVLTENRGYVEASELTKVDVIVADPFNTRLKSITPIDNEDVYDITVEDNHNFFANGVLVHNCGEIFMGPYDSCRLQHVNMASFVENGVFNLEKLEKVAYQNMRLCDDLVELELEHVDNIIAHIKSSYTEDEYNELKLWEHIRETGSHSRRAGCGATGVADAIALVGYSLTSPEGMELLQKMFEAKMRGELRAQVELAKERGTFYGYDFDKEFYYEEDKETGMTVLRGRNEFFDRIAGDTALAPEDIIEGLEKYGRRSVSWSTMAPVGSGAMMCQGTSGVEPLFAPFYKRRKKCVGDEVATIIDNNGERFIEFFVVHQPLKRWIIAHPELTGYDVTKTFDEQVTDDKMTEWFQKSPWYKSTASELTPHEHVDIQAIVQRYTTHSISKTENMPNNATEEEVSELFMYAWEKGCKGTTVYRDGCRNNILETATKKNDKDCDCKCNGTLTHSAPRRPKVLPCDIQYFRNAGQKWVACVGLYEGQPYELFTGLAEKLNIPEYVTTAEIVKTKVDKLQENDETGVEEIKKVSRYDIRYVDADGNTCVMEGIDSAFRTEYYSVSKLISGLLRHGMPVEYVVSTIKSLDFKDVSINSWKSGVTRTLKHYIADGEVAGEVCPECGGKLIRENGCIHCIECGWSKCG